MDTIERVVRVMTHVNIGAALGMAAWVAWSGLLVVGGHWKVPAPAPTRAAETAANAQPAELPCCFVPRPGQQRNPIDLRVDRLAGELIVLADARWAP